MQNAAKIYKLAWQRSGSHHSSQQSSQSHWYVVKNHFSSTDCTCACHSEDHREGSSSNHCPKLSDEFGLLWAWLLQGWLRNPPSGLGCSTSGKGGSRVTPQRGAGKTARPEEQHHISNHQHFLSRSHSLFLILGPTLPALRTLPLITPKSHKHHKKEVNIRSVIPFRALQIL